MADAIAPICEFDDCEQPAICDLHLHDKGCLYLCEQHRNEVMGASNWTAHELDAHTRQATPVWADGWTNKEGKRLEIDGLPARERAWRP